VDGKLFIYKISTRSSGAGGRPLLFSSGLESPLTMVQIGEFPLSSRLQGCPKLVCLCVFWGHLIGLLRLLGLILVSGKGSVSGTRKKSLLGNNASRRHHLHPLETTAVKLKYLTLTDKSVRTLLTPLKEIM
jgi:hypothetical protein